MGMFNTSLELDKPPTIPEDIQMEEPCSIPQDNKGKAFSKNSQEQVANQIIF